MKPSRGLARWNAFWFDQVPGHSLGLVRLFFGLALVMRCTNASGLYRWGDLQLSVPLRPLWDVGEMLNDWHMPFGALLWLPVPGAFWFARLEDAFLLLALLLMLGFATRIVAPLTAGLFSYMFFLSWWNYHHHFFLFLIVLWILAFSPCGRHYSLDALVAGRPATPISVLPLRMLQTLVVVVYVFTLLWKCTPAWWEGTIIEVYAQAGALKGPLAQWLTATVPAHILGRGILVVEVLIPLLLVVPGARLAGIWLGVMLHLGIDLTMDVGTFGYQMMALYIAWLYPAAGSHVVLFDGHCGICRGSRRWSRLLDWFDRLRWLSFRDEQLQPRIAFLAAEALEQEMHVITPRGKVLKGFAGWRHLMTRFPLTFLLAWLLYLPPFPWVGQRVYAYVAARRRLICELPVTDEVKDSGWQTALSRAASNHSRMGPM